MSMLNATITGLLGDATSTIEHTPPILEEVYITKYALDRTIGVYKVTGVVHPQDGSFTRNGTLYIHDEWQRTEKQALARVKAMARKAMRRLMNEHNHAKNIMLDVNDGRLLASRKP